MLRRTALLVALFALLLSALLLAGCERERPAPTPGPARVTPVMPAATGASPTLAPGQTRTTLPTRTSVTPAPGAATPAPGAAPAAPVAPAPLISPTPAPPRPVAPAAPTAQPAAGPATGYWVYKVVFGDSLNDIARRFNVSADALLTLNGITNADLIAVGQDLKIPGEAPPEYGGARPYTVRVGDTLSRIARDFGVSQDELAKLNNITNPDQLKVGQQLRIPTTGASPAAGPARTHTVRAGETLSTIAQQYGVTPWALQTANNITNANQIYAGQVLKIP